MSDKVVHNIFLAKPNKAWLVCSHCHHKTFIEIDANYPTPAIKTRRCWFCNLDTWRITVVDSITPDEPGQEEQNASR